jgi:signal transduction histidine kinase
MRLDKEGVEGASKDLEIIVKQIDRVSGLIGSLLQFADGRTANRVLPVNLALTLDNVIELFRVDLQKQGIDLVCDIPREAHVLAENDGLQQVFINLVINAMHAMESHASAVKHRISVVSHEGATVWVVVVTDTGSGIPKKYLSEIFKPFFTTKDVGKGTGLGLPTTYQFVQSWGGTIGVESKEGYGTTFTLVLRKARL